MAETFALTTVWKLQYVKFGDQGGCVGDWTRYFHSKEDARAWFDLLRATYTDEEYAIYKEEVKQAFVSPSNTVYLVEKNYCKITEVEK